MGRGDSLQGDRCCQRTRTSQCPYCSGIAVPLAPPILPAPEEPPILPAPEVPPTLPTLEEPPVLPASEVGDLTMVPLQFGRSK
jgi:hypothetical protein